MNDLWMIGMVGGGAGIAVSAPLLLRPPRNRVDRWSGIWVLNAALAMLLIGLRHGPVFPAPVDRVLEHATNTMSLVAWPALVVLTHLAFGRTAGWWTAPRLFVPALLYVAAVAIAGGRRVPFEWLLPISIICAVQVTSVARSARLTSRDDSLRRRAFAMMMLAILLCSTQMVRTAFSDVLLIREVVPAAMTICFIGIGLALYDAPVVPRPTEQPRYERSGLTTGEAEELLARLDSAMRAEHWYRDSSLTLRGLAGRLGVPAHRLSQALNQGRERTLVAYLAEWRLSDVAARLADGANDCFTVDALAERSGFASRSAFYAAFRKSHGMTPTEYRKRLGRPPN